MKMPMRTTNPFRMIKLSASGAAVASFLLVSMEGQELTTANHYRVSRMLPGFEFSHPSDWAVERLKANAQLKPPGQSDTEIYAMGVEELAEPIRLDSAQMIEKIQADVQRNF